ncbi:hypothetical protein RB608_16745 [Nocardioides sp. LHD-245]|uniref:hypothetical protein n=1 Tax=Nocardioides sp. LHD-245 TaxID=3051387 RepID=UPI0027DEC1CF|nr:hypothetical protein [Nocardioides sp. LHD-245]
MRPDAESDAESGEWRAYDASPYPGEGRSAYPAYPAYDPATERRRVRRRVGVLVIGALVVLGGTGAGIAALVANALDGDSGTTTSTTTTTTTTRTEITTRDGGADLFTTEGTAAMVEALAKESGSTWAYEVVLFQGNAVLTVPGDDGPRTLLWDGVSMTAAAGGFSSRKPFDLADLDGAVLAPLCGNEPASCTVLAGRPLPGAGDAWLTVAGTGGVRLTDLAGKPA